MARTGVVRWHMALGIRYTIGSFAVVKILSRFPRNGVCKFSHKIYLVVTSTYILHPIPQHKKKFITIMPSGTNSQGNSYNTPGGTNSSQGSSYHCKSSLFLKQVLCHSIFDHCNSIIFTHVTYMYSFRL